MRLKFVLHILCKGGFIVDNFIYFFIVDNFRYGYKYRKKCGRIYSKILVVVFISG